jgi:dGTPase
MHKTQVFLAPAGDHYRTRLTHTLEVTQIARCMARALRLNEDLTEAIGLGHDLGHTPFGHAGEVAMRACFSPDFAHYEQSKRVVEKLENDGLGLNLTWEVRDGIVNHTGDHQAATLEGVLVKVADRIAYINHDIDDAVRAGILSEDEIPGDLIATLGYTHSQRINSMVNAVISESRGRSEIRMNEEIYEATMLLRKFLFDRVYVNSEAKLEEAKSREMLIRLFEHFRTHPEQMPAQFARESEESVERRVCEYIAGMTDRYASDLCRDLFIPQGWKHQ